MLFKDMYAGLDIVGISAKAKNVLVALMVRADDKNTCHPSYERLAKDTQLSRIFFFKPTWEVLKIFRVAQAINLLVYKARIGVETDK